MPISVAFNENQRLKIEVLVQNKRDQVRVTVSGIALAA